MAREQKEQLVKIFARTAQAYAALMMYYDNLADKTEIIHLKKRQDSNDDSRDNSYFSK